MLDRVLTFGAIALWLAAFFGLMAFAASMEEACQHAAFALTH